MANQPIEVGLMRDGRLKEVTLQADSQSSEETDTEGALFGLAWQTSLSGMEFAAKTAPLPDYNFSFKFRQRR